MNSTYFFTDFNKQQAEYAQLKQLNRSVNNTSVNNRGANNVPDFIGLYGDASILAAADLDAPRTLIWQTLSQHREIYVCPSAAARRGIDTAHAHPPQAGLRWLSLAGMLERIAPKAGAPWALGVRLSSDTDLARIEALELCLAALALDFRVQLSLYGAGILGLQRSLARTGAKGYASLAMFGLAHALIAPEEMRALAPLTLSPESLSLPWQLGIAAPVALIFDF